MKKNPFSEAVLKAFARHGGGFIVGEKRIDILL